MNENESNRPEQVLHQKDPLSQVNRLMMAVIQEQDIDIATSALTKLGVSVTRLASTGGFLRRRNIVLLIGYSAGQEEAAERTLRNSCRRRVEYLATPLEGSPLPFPTPMPVTVGGATVFSFEVERYEEV